MKILITGTSSGIGFGLAQYYCEQNHQVIGFSRRANEKLLNYKTYKHYQLDLSHFEGLIDYLPSVFEFWDDFDLIILNAGILGEIKRFEDHNQNDIRMVMDINVWANKVIIDEIIKSQIVVKQIVAISSGAAKNGSAGWGPYSVSKAALNMLIKTYASENPQIHFSAVAPGLVDTAIQEYISSLSSKEFPAIQRLQAARGTEAMPCPEDAAAVLNTTFEKVLEMESGVFVDVREL